MRVIVCFLYVALTITYLAFGDSSPFWGGLNIITNIGFVGYLCFLLKDIKVFTEDERLFFTYLQWLSVANCLYIFVCIIKDTSFAIYNTDIFAYIMGIGFVVFMIHCALNKQ